MKLDKMLMRLFKTAKTDLVVSRGDQSIEPDDSRSRFIISGGLRQLR
ncbi:hypothetical protein RCCGEPOP_25417 [Rhizobium sp. Pop5]|nr:hypothetical protein RCCGEPOP_25417 [Rhizobium sp. Pop5]